MINQIASSATALQQSQQKIQVSYAVAGKQLDNQRQQGHFAVELLKAAADLAARVSANSIDTYA